MDQHIITIAALGPDGVDQLTFGAFNVMRNAKTLVLRTERHGVGMWLREQGIAFETLDALYEQSEDFDELCAAAAKTLVQKARDSGSVCYAVSDPTNDATVRALACNLPEDCEIHVMGGVTLAAQTACAALVHGVNTENLRTITALSIDSFRPQADSPQAIVEIDSRCLASDVKLWLSDLFDDEMTVYFLEDASKMAALPIRLCELDRQPHYDHRTAVLVPAVSVYERKRANYEDFAQVIARLRAPGGCPWDRAQTMHTLRRYMIEEACEAAEAMDGDDPFKIADELGDVLLQVVLVSAIAAEHREFTDRDVTSIAARKMISRHEHVFGNAQAKDADAVISVWENAKRKERGNQTVLERVLDVPATLPALMRAQKVIRRMTTAQPDADACREAIRMAHKALERLPDAGKAEHEALLGELLESCCALAHALDLDAETALRSATAARIDRLRVQMDKKD